MKYYLHRIAKWYPEWSIPLLDKMNLLSYGGAALASRSDFISKHQHHWPSVRDTIKQEWPGSRWGGQLERFLAMDTGDWVVVPRERAFDVYEVADDARLVPAEIEDELARLEAWQEKNATIRGRLLVERNESGEHEPNLGFFRRVKPIEQGIPREGYADAPLTKRMKTQWANVEINDLGNSVKEAVERHKSNRPINLRHLIKDECRTMVRDAIRHYKNPGSFEDLIKSYLEHQGASTVKPSSNARKKEGDADIIATFETLALIVYVQAKHHEGETDEWAVQQIERYRDHKGGNEPFDGYTRAAWVVSNADGFSADCKEQARDARVRLINGIEFAEMLLDAGIEHI